MSVILWDICTYFQSIKLYLSLAFKHYRNINVKHNGSGLALFVHCLTCILEFIIICIYTFSILASMDYNLCQLQGTNSILQMNNENCFLWSLRWVVHWETSVVPHMLYISRSSFRSILTISSQNGLLGRTSMDIVSPTDQNNQYAEATASMFIKGIFTRNTKFKKV